MQYFAVQVRIGSESIVASRLKSLNEKNGSTLFGNILIPLEQIKHIDTTNSVMSVNQHLLFQGYVFVELQELNPKTFQLIRSVSGAVYSVLPSPIESHELGFLLEERVNVTIESARLNNEIIEKMKEIIELKKNNLHKMRLFMKGVFKRTFSFPQTTFIKISTKIRLTISELLQNPEKLLLGVLEYDTSCF